jgi:putative nucleotidyltransferase with HDIG domain
MTVHAGPSPDADVMVSPEALRQKVGRLKSLPTLPRLLEGVVEALEDPEVDFENVAELIEVDQSLTSQILRLANSAFYGAQGTIAGVTQALVMLGAAVTRSLVISTSVLDIRQVEVQGFWEHSIGSAVAAGAISKLTGLGNPEEVTAAGLLHDIGKVVLYKELPDAFGYILYRAQTENQRFRDVERDVLGLDHGEIAAWLVEKWNFPTCLAEPIMYHHTPALAHRAREATAIVHVANTLVRGLGYGSGGDARIPPIEPRAWARLKLTPAVLDRILATFDADLDHALNYALFQ